MPDFPGDASGKQPTCQCRRHRDTGLLPGLGRSPGGGHGSSFQYYLENPLDRWTWGLQSIGSQRAGHDWSNWVTHARCHFSHWLQDFSVFSFQQFEYGVSWYGFLWLYLGFTQLVKFKGLCLLPSYSEF